MKEDWKSLRLKADLKCGMRTSFRLTPNAQRKNKLVIRMKGRTYFRLVRGTDWGDKLPPSCFSLISHFLGDRNADVRKTREPVILSAAKDLNERILRPSIS